MNDSTFQRRAALAHLAAAHGLVVLDEGSDTYYVNEEAGLRLRVTWYCEPHPIGTRPSKWTDTVCEVFNQRHEDSYPLNGGWIMTSMRTSAYSENFRYALERIVEIGAAQ